MVVVASLLLEIGGIWSVMREDAPEWGGLAVSLAAALLPCFGNSGTRTATVYSRRTVHVVAGRIALNGLSAVKRRRQALVNWFGGSGVWAFGRPHVCPVLSCTLTHSHRCVSATTGGGVRNGPNSDYLRGNAAGGGDGGRETGVWKMLSTPPSCSQVELL